MPSNESSKCQQDAEELVFSQFDCFELEQLERLSCGVGRLEAPLSLFPIPFSL